MGMRKMTLYSGLAPHANGKGAIKKNTKKQHIGEEPPKMMPLKENSQGSQTAPSTPTVKDEALYLYCVGDGAIEASYGNIGIDGKIVYTIPYKGITAVVHKCPPELYQSEDNETVKGWVITHQSVVDATWEKFGTVLPSGFDTIIKGGEAASAEENLKKWLEENYEKLKENLERVKGKSEFGVQIFLDRKVVAQSIMETSEEIKRLTEEIKEKSLGLAYFYRQKIERVLKRELEEKAHKYFNDFYSSVKRYADYVRIEKTKRTEEDKQMIMNLSVLIQKDKIKLLGEQLARLKEIKGIEVRFTGPWPPYSFVTPA